MDTAQQGNNKLYSQANVGRSTALRCIEASSLPSTGACARVAWIRSGTVRVVCRWGSDRGCGRGYEVPIMIKCIIDVLIISFPDSFRAALECWDFRTCRWAIRLTELVFGCETTAWLLIFVHVMINITFFLLKKNIIPNRAGCLLRTLGSEPGGYSIAQM